MTEIVRRLHDCVMQAKLDEKVILQILSKENHIRECEVLDFKRQVPSTRSELCKTLRDLVAFHNSYGGFIVFGVDEELKDRDFRAIGVDGRKINAQQLRDLAMNYLGFDLRMQAFELNLEGITLEVIWVSKRLPKEKPVQFLKSGPEEAGQPIFKNAQIVFRRIDCNGIAEKPEDYQFLYSDRHPPSLDIQPSSVAMVEHSLPDRDVICSKFVGRSSDLSVLWRWLLDDFSRVRLIAGEGGLGKTSLAYRFAEDIVVQAVPPFQKVVWLTAKTKNFIAIDNRFLYNLRTDFTDSTTLFSAICYAHGALAKDFNDRGSSGYLELAVDFCKLAPTLIIIDNIDSLSQNDQRLALEFGLKVQKPTKVILTTRVNHSYADANVLILQGLVGQEYVEYVKLTRSRHKLKELTRQDVDRLYRVTRGSPLFSESLFRLERQGQSFSHALQKWIGQKGVEVRQAALKAEITSLSREAKRVLYAVYTAQFCTHSDILKVVDYTDETLQDALLELKSLFLIDMPSVFGNSSYSLDPNTALTVGSLAHQLDIDHAALTRKMSRVMNERSGKKINSGTHEIGRIIFEARKIASDGNVKQALQLIEGAIEKNSLNKDLWLAKGFFCLKLVPIKGNEAIAAFARSYELGQTKKLLFDIWFWHEYENGNLEKAYDVATKAIHCGADDCSAWYELRAKIRIVWARRAETDHSVDSALREYSQAVSELDDALAYCSDTIKQEILRRIRTKALRQREKLK